MKAIRDPRQLGPAHAVMCAECRSLPGELCTGLHGDGGGGTAPVHVSRWLALVG